MYKIETHLHTIPVSSCAHFSPEEMTRFYKDAGYSTIFVSDHFSPYHYKKLGNYTWEEKNAMLYDSYLRAKAVGDEIGINVLFSPELSCDGNHFLLYNATLDFLNSRSDFFDMKISEFREYSQKYGITIVQAHPFRDEKCVPKPEHVDGFEVINANPRHENFDEKAIAIAKEYDLLMSAGSDAHQKEDIALAAVVSPYEVKTTEDYLNLLRSGEAKLMKNGEYYDLSDK